jgi:hypothetical protein
MRSRQRRTRDTALAVGLPLVVGLVHVATVAPHYFVGSFDDDSSYVMSARALAAGHGLTAHVASGDIVAGSYPSGYPLLLAPLVKAFPGTFLPLRLLSVACFAALFPLTWIYLRRRRVPESIAALTLVVLALCPSLATFGSMVMAETPFLVLFLLLLLAAERWQLAPRTWAASGVATIVAAAGLVWCKEAAIAMVVGLALWLVTVRQLKKAAVLLLAVGASLIPVVVARAMAGVPLAGTRYAAELGAFYTGGWAGRVRHVVPQAFHQYISMALPATIIPRGAPFPQTGVWAQVLQLFLWHVTVACVVGSVVWYRRHRDAAILIVPVYAAETLFWPYINERRVLLVLPVLAAWYVLGLAAIGTALAHWLHARRGVDPRRVLAGWLVFTVVVAGTLVASQFSRDYLFGDGQDSSRPQGSRYMQLLAATPDRHTIVESDYLSTTALFSGHPTAATAFVDNVTVCLPVGVTTADLARDRSGYLLLGAVNKPDLIDNPCLLTQSTGAPWAVRLLQSERDQASVFELIGPGTAHPDLTDVVAGLEPAQATMPGGGTLTWTLPAPRPISQVAVGEAGASRGASGVEVDLLTPAGTWYRVASSGRGVGDGAVNTPFLLAPLRQPVMATALRITVHGQGQIAALDVSALGPAAGAP